MNKTLTCARSLGAFCALATALTGLTQTQAQQVTAKPAKTWEQSITAGMTLSRGNSKNFLGSLSYKGARKWTSDELFLDASGGYGKSTTGGVKKKTDDYFRAGAQLNHTLKDNFYAGVKLNIAHDDLADLDYRFSVSPLVGYYFVKNDKMILSGEVGPSYVKERQGGKTKDYMGARLGERFEYKINDRAKVWQTLEVIPQIDDFNNTIFVGEIGIDTAITDAWSLRLVFQDTYDNVPAKGLLKNDSKVIAGISYKF